MGKRSKLEIEESLGELKKVLAKQKTLKLERRVRSLILIKSKKFDTRQEVADYLGVHKRTMERWLQDYSKKGISGMLTIEPKNKGSKIISQEIHNGLKQRVYDPNNPFLGYWDAQQWVNKQYGVEVKYQRIREYLIQHFSTKLKTPRKSHYKKDLEAEKAFLKTTEHAE